MAGEPTQEAPARRRGLLRGPSEGLQAWTTYWQGVIDWGIDARARSRAREAERSARRTSLHLAGAAAGGSAIVVLAKVAESLLIG